MIGISASVRSRCGRLALWLRLLPRLGVDNVAAVALHRALVRAGWYQRRLPIGRAEVQPLFFDQPSLLPLGDIDATSILAEADALIAGEMRWFSHHRLPITSPPDWSLNPFTGKHLDATQHWSRLADFDPAVGDIKCVWEPSRFDWALLLARAYRLTGAGHYLKTLNDWCCDWQRRNPPNAGPNWKCGQETSIRVLTVLLTSYLLGQHQAPAAGLVSFVRRHCERIAPTIGYALAQDNNHGTSEAAGLLIGGAWLARVSSPDAGRGQHWARLGRRWLEGCVLRLVQRDGSFAQHSLNYHRVLLDTLSMAEFWRRELELEPFTPLFHERSRTAANWLFQMTDSITGDGPNLGANDGARLFVLHSQSYRDYRPSVQLAYALFLGGRAYDPGPWDEPLRWLHLQAEPIAAPARSSSILHDGGYVMLHSPLAEPRSWGLVRFPNYKTRPAHADALHFDLWANGVNLLRDGGSYSYAVDQTDCRLSECRAHNTIQFDGHDQMPSLGRFLYADWLKADFVGDLEPVPGGYSWAGAYTDHQGCHHERTVSVIGHRWRVTDRVQGAHRAILRWRLAPDSWALDTDRGLCMSRYADISIQTDKPALRLELTQAWESRHYLEKTLIPVLEVEAEVGQGVFESVTEIALKSAP